MCQNANLILVILQLEIIQKRPFLYSVLSKGMVFSLPLEESNL